MPLTKNVTKDTEEPRDETDSYSLSVRLMNYRYVSHLWVDTQGVRVIMTGGGQYDRDAVIGLLDREFGLSYVEEFEDPDGNTGLWFDR